MIKKILMSISLKLLDWAMSQVWKLIDTDKNGEISMAELDDFMNDLRKRIVSLKRKIKK